MSAIHLAGEEMNLIFRESEVNKTKKLYAAGENAWGIGKKLDRDPDEIAILIIDLARRGALKVKGR